MDIFKSMMTTCHLPESFRVEAWKTAACNLNRVPSKYVPLAPFELLSDRKPSRITFLFGFCPTEVKIHNSKIKKTYPRSKSYFYYVSR